MDVSDNDITPRHARLCSRVHYILCQVEKSLVFRSIQNGQVWIGFWSIMQCNPAK